MPATCGHCGGDSDKCACKFTRAVEREIDRAYGEYALWIPGRLPGLNDIVAAAKAGRNRGAMYSEQKRAAEARIEAAIYDAELPRFERVTLAYELVEPPGPPNKDRDIGNVLAGATKYVEDALVRAGVLPTDGPGCIVGYDKTTRRVDAMDGVRVTIRRA